MKACKSNSIKTRRPVTQEVERYKQCFDLMKKDPNISQENKNLIIGFIDEYCELYARGGRPLSWGFDIIIKATSEKRNVSINL